MLFEASDLPIVDLPVWILNMSLVNNVIVLPLSTNHLT